MPATRLLAVAATACAAVAFAAPLSYSASAAPGGGDGGRLTVDVDPYAVHQGGSLRITVDGCRQGGTITSNAFARTRLPAAPSGHASATARIDDRATPGNYNLAVQCDDNPTVATHQFSVVAGRAVDGGLGGSERPGSAETAVGAAMAASAAVGGSLFIVRRRRAEGAAS